MPEFTLSGNDGHSSALMELYALLLEKEGSSATIVKDIRDEAALLADQAREQGMSVLSLDALLMFASSIKQQDITEEPQAIPQRKAWNAPFEVGEIVCSGMAGAPAKLTALFPDDESVSMEGMRGKSNIRLPRSTGVVTVETESLRRATVEEMQAYQDAGGR